jgi:signal transduction histidine kinase
VVTITLMLLCWRIVTGPARMFYTHLDDMWFHFGPALIASFILLPLVIVDIIRASNRFVGPMLRLQRSMRQLARGEDVEPIEFREGDLWHEFATEFNALRTRMQASTAAAEAKSADREQEEPAEVGA